MSPAANLSELPEFFEKRIFTYPRSKELFSNLCENGCSQNDLATLLLAVSTYAIAKRDEPLLNSGGLSTSQLARLRRELIWVGGMVDRVNNSTLNPTFDILLAPPDASRQALRETTARLYDMLPKLMQVYSMHLEQFSKFTKANLRRLTVTHYYALRLLRYIQEKTGSPRYDDTANLLIAGFLAVGGAQSNIPKFFTAEALTKLNQRTAKLRY